MAFRTKPNPATDLGLPPIAEQPRLKQLFEIRSALESELRRTEARIELDRIDKNLDSTSITTAAFSSGNSGFTRSSRYESIQYYRDVLKQRIGEQPTPSSTDIGGLPPSVHTALRVVAGGELKRPMDPAEYRKSLENHRQKIHEALGDLEAQIQVIRDEIDAEVALALREPHREMVLDIYRAAQALAAAVDREAACHRSVISLGYSWVEGLAPRWPLGAGTLLGSERDQNSHISQYRENLERLGILK